MNFIRRLDLFIILPSLSISCLSIFLLLGSAAELFIPQLIFTLIGLIFYFIIISIDYTVWPRFLYLLYAVSILLLSVIFFLPQVRGAHRWIDFGVFILQPSEILKPIVILFYATLLVKLRKLDLSNLFWLILSFLPLTLLIFLQPDLGNSIIYSAFFLGLLIIGGVSLKFLFSGFLLFLSLLPVIWIFLKDYQKLRIFSFLNPGLDPSGAGYNAIQSMIAIGSGGLFGLGLGKGTQSRLLFLPEYQTDFIFASLIESLGFLGGFILLILYLFLLSRILLIALNCDNMLGRIISIGIFCQLIAQVIINVGMNIGLLPITGITLPLLSYGGSSIVSTYASLGLLNSISQSLPKKLLVIR